MDGAERKMKTEQRKACKEERRLSKWKRRSNEESYQLEALLWEERRQWEAWEVPL